MNIGIDVDDVLYDTSAEVGKLIDKSGNPILKEHRLEMMRGAMSELPEEVAQFIKDTILIYTNNAKPLDNAIEVLKKLKAENHRIVFITARSNNIRSGVVDATLNSFKKYGIEEGIAYDKIVFYGADKVGVCKQENIDLFVDDSPVNCQLVKDSGIDVIAFKSKVTADAINKSGLPSASSWNELYEMIKK